MAPSRGLERWMASVSYIQDADVMSMSESKKDTRTRDGTNPGKLIAASPALRPALQPGESICTTVMPSSALRSASTWGDSSVEAVSTTMTCIVVLVAPCLSALRTILPIKSPLLWQRMITTKACCSLWSCIIASATRPHEYCWSVVERSSEDGAGSSEHASDANWCASLAWWMKGSPLSSSLNVATTGSPANPYSNTLTGEMVSRSGPGANGSKPTVAACT
mmetsp:Transcript_17291/g.65502  ORF Transcript_17291/g.65502 Transcript_17291/m.65502 type:complete len:221 (+) Transcript_17291:1158-1820(+)